MTNVTVKAEIKIVPPPPPKSVVVITMEFHDAILLRDDIRSAITASDIQRFGLNRLINELDQLNLET
jgi:hypothetical protein